MRKFLLTIFAKTFFLFFLAICNVAKSDSVAVSADKTQSTDTSVQQNIDTDEVTLTVSGNAQVDDCGLCGGPNSNPETNWCFIQSTTQAFYLLEKLTIDGSDIKGDGMLSSSECFSSGICDVVGAFINRNGDEVCVGWVYADSGGHTSVPLMGNDGSSTSMDYLVNGESAYLKIYDASNGSTLNVAPGDELPGFSIDGIFIISGISSANNTISK